ncbi:MAG TPA: von Willebrand factor type A domain-containing protein [Verrucomicrobiae bacterium]|jgi:Mg-chelatase subunit ChlD
MKPELPSMNRETLEAKVTALLLGELPEGEAALLRELIARDAELAKFHAQLGLTLGLLRETVATPEPAPSAPMKFSEERREKLLAHFKTVAPKEFARPPRRRNSWLAPLAAAAVVLLLAVVVPYFNQAQKLSMRKSVVNDLISLDSAKHQWALEQRKSDSDVPTLKDLEPYLNGRGERDKALAKDSQKYKFEIGPVGRPPVARPKSESGAHPQASYGAGEDLTIRLPGDEGNLAVASTDLNSAARSLNRGSIGVQGGTAPSYQAEELESAARSKEKAFMARARRREAIASATEFGSGSIEPQAQSASRMTEGRSMMRSGSAVPVPLQAAPPPPGFANANNGDNLAQLHELDNATQNSQNAVAQPPRGQTYNNLNRGSFGANLNEPQSARNQTWGTVDSAIGHAVIPRGGTAAPSQEASDATGQSGFLTGVNVGRLSARSQTAVPVVAEKQSPADDKDSRDLFIPQAEAVAGNTIGVSKVASLSRNPQSTRTALSGSIQSFGGGGGAGSTVQDSSQKDEEARVGKIATVGGGFSMQTATPPTFPAVDLAGVVVANPGGLTGGTGVVELKKEALDDKADAPMVQSVLPPPIPQPEEETQSNKFSTFSLNISDASYKLAAASLQNGAMPQPASIRSEEFINAFDYRDPDPPAGAPIGFAWDRAQNPFAHNRDWLRFSVKAAAQGREAGRPLNLVLLLDKSGSMERADRVAIIHEALRVLASQLNEQDTLSVVVFARTARLWLDGVPGSKAGDAASGLDGITPDGGTNLEDAMKLAYETTLRHYAANGENRVVLLTDGAANLGNVNPEILKRSVKANREQGIALDCFGVGWDGYNDNLMETLSRTGNGRYGFINTPEEAGTEFAGKLAGALRVAASDVKVQVEFNPSRVTAWRQIGYAKHQLTKEQFRDNTVAAAQIGAAESGNALYTIEVNPAGDGPICTVRVRFRTPGTSDYQEHAWDVPYSGTSVALDNATPATRLAATAGAFSEWLALSPYAGDITPDQLLGFLRGVPEAFGADARPKNLEWMIRQAKSISGK